MGKTQFTGTSLITVWFLFVNTPDPPTPPPSLQHINPLASTLIKRMLHADPGQRPTIAEVIADEFFTSGYIPLRLPTTCLTVPPRFSIAPSTAGDLSQRRPLTAINNKGKVLSPIRGLTVWTQLVACPSSVVPGIDVE